MTSRRTFLSAALGAGIAPVVGGGSPANAWSPSVPLPVFSAAALDSAKPPAIFFHAHQDDETLTLGPAIEEHVNANRDVIAVLLTDGAGSGARAADVSPTAFSLARDLELAAAYAALGVRQCFVEGGADGHLSWEEAAAVIWKWTARFPTASFKAPTWMDSHPDHAIIGEVLRNRWMALRQTLDARFYVKREDWDRVGAQVPTWRTRGGRRTLAAGAVYRAGIGYRSVPASFDALAADPQTMVHLPNV